MVVSRLARLLAALAGAAALWTAVAESTASVAPRPAPRAAAIQQTAQAAARAPRGTDARRRRPGCGRFCRQAGGFGAGPEPKVKPVLILRQQVRVDRDGVIAIRATCQLAKACVGAILVDSASASYGRADLRIPAHATRRVRVAVPARGLRYLRRRHRDRRAFATVPLTDNNLPVSISSTLTILAPR